jgi:hypothetical protein
MTNVVYKVKFGRACSFDPTRVNEPHPSLNDVDNLRMLPFLDSNVIVNGLKHELPTYMALADGISMDASKLD